MEIIIALAVVGLLVLFFVAQYNRLIRLNISVDESFAQIEVQLKRRSDLIPNLVETVKGMPSTNKAHSMQLSLLALRQPPLQPLQM